MNDVPHCQFARDSISRVASRRQIVKVQSHAALHPMMHSSWLLYLTVAGTVEVAHLGDDKVAGGTRQCSTGNCGDRAYQSRRGSRLPGNDNLVLACKLFQI